MTIKLLSCVFLNMKRVVCSRTIHVLRTTVSSRSILLYGGVLLGNIKKLKTDTLSESPYHEKLILQYNIVYIWQ